MSNRVKWLAAAAVTVLAAGPVTAGHSWGTYHWQKGSGELTIPVGDNVDSKWDEYLVVALGVDSAGAPAQLAKPSWNDSIAIASPLVAGGTTPKRCKAATGRIEVCNARYGRTGWLGVAGISISGGHIVSGYTKVNDTYFDTAKYNTPGWRRMVMCQEIGHDYGLGHTDENFDNPNHGTCMDYTNDPSRDDGVGNNEYQNAHDFEQLESIYSHSHQATTDFGERQVGKPAAPGASAGLEGGNSPAEWGRAIGYDGEGRPNLFERSEPGRKIITHVLWAIGEGPKGGHHGD